MIDLKLIRIEELALVGPSYAKKLKKLGIETLWDLYHHIPTRFLDFSKKIPINELQLDEIATIHGEITSFVNTYTKSGKSMQIVTIDDGTGKVQAIWFNQIYLSRVFREGSQINIAGKLTFMGKKRAIISPEYEVIHTDGAAIHTAGIIPIYSETTGISSKWLRRRIFDSWKKYGEGIEEFLPTQILSKYNLVDFKTALHDSHFPSDMEIFERAKYRLAFNELLSLHTKNIKRKKAWEKNRVSAKLTINNLKETVEKFIKSLPFHLTLSQQEVVDEILIDLQKDTPMNRLLEGDVGSGKTVVAAIASYSCFLAGKKTIFMAPTQILAQQHFQTLNNLFRDTKVKIGIITSSSKINIDADILIGTHALLKIDINIKDIGLIVIDEQHKFGVEQRNMLIKKGEAPHILTMTATPIPRTVALTFFGDLELSTLNELPAGRQKITTWVVPEVKREDGFRWIEKQIKENKIQAFVVCPLIEESESETMVEVKAANNEYEKLQKTFPKLKIGLMHGKLKNKEKENVVSQFKNGDIDILVSTPVVEVGVDIPNATIMVIEAADRFGLASLHQLRGRVGRGSKKSYCLLMTENESERTKMRLEAMTTHISGFELSEIDLAMRGPGEIYGSTQSGIPELKIADWRDLELIKTTKEVADKLSNKI